jgi:acyl-CoA synthetase (AMP-forming)/AMP-acid ligase II
MILSGGENVYPAQIEGVLDSHPAVDQAAVVGMPDEKWGEVPVAFVVIREGSAISEEALKDYMRSKLARYKVPKRIIFQKELPLTSTGKINRRKLEKQATNHPD